MASLRTRSSFFETEEGKVIKQKLEQMVGNETYNTGKSYSSNSVLYPDNRLPFVDKHMNYIVNHPSLDANMYLANIRLMTKVR